MGLHLHKFFKLPTTFVIPAQAGIHFNFKSARPIEAWAHNWIPAFTGMTV